MSRETRLRLARDQALYFPPLYLTISLLLSLPPLILSPCLFFPLSSCLSLHACLSLPLPLSPFLSLPLSQYLFLSPSPTLSMLVSPLLSVILGERRLPADDAAVPDSLRLSPPWSLALSFLSGSFLSVSPRGPSLSKLWSMC